MDTAQPSVTPVPGDPAPSSDFQKHYTHGAQTFIEAKHPYMQNNEIITIIFI